MRAAEELKSKVWGTGGPWGRWVGPGGDTAMRVVGDKGWGGEGESESKRG